MSAAAVALGASGSPSLLDARRWPGWGRCATPSRDARITAVMLALFSVAVAGVWILRHQVSQSSELASVSPPAQSASPIPGGNVGLNVQPPTIPPPPLPVQPGSLSPSNEPDAAKQLDDVIADPLPGLGSRSTAPAPSSAEDLPLPGLSNEDASTSVAPPPPTPPPTASRQTSSSAAVDQAELGSTQVRPEAAAQSQPGDLDAQAFDDVDIPPSPPQAAPIPLDKIRPASPPSEPTRKAIPAQRTIVAQSVGEKTQAAESNAPAQAYSVASDRPAVELQDPPRPIGGGTGQILARSRPTVLPPAVRRDDRAGEPLALLGSEVIASTAPESSTVQTTVDPPETTSTTATQELIPLDEAGQRYLVVGVSRDGPPKEYDLIGNPITRRDDALLAASGTGPPAYSPSTVRSFVYKTEPTRSPVVRSYDVAVYLALEGDTFESVAQTMFKDRAYADALAKYNRSRLGPADAIPVGARVRIPPRWVLDGGEPPSSEQFQRVDAPTVQQAVRSQAVVSGSSPAGPREPPFDQRLAGAGPTMSGLVYRVAQEETLWSIAAKTLGDGRRWREIQKLNGDRLTDAVQVPAGAVLRLPDDAVNASQ